MLRKVYLVLFFLSFAFYSYAARPLSTDDSGCVEKGHFESEWGVEYVNQLDKEVNLSLVLKRGILDNLDFGIEVPYKFIDLAEGAKTEGFSDIKLMAKLNLIKQIESLPDVSLSFAYKSDSANDEKSLGTGKPECTITGIFSKVFNNIALHSNLGYTFKKDFDDSDNEDTFNYALALEYAVNDRLCIVSEIAGDTVLKREFDDNACGGLVGFNYALNEKITIDTGFAFEISEASPDFKVTSGLTISF